MIPDEYDDAEESLLYYICSHSQLRSHLLFGSENLC